MLQELDMKMMNVWWINNMEYGAVMPLDILNGLKTFMEVIAQPFNSQ